MMMMMMMTKIVDYSQPDSSDSSCYVLQPCFCTRPAAKGQFTVAPRDWSPTRAYSISTKGSVTRASMTTVLS